MKDTVNIQASPRRSKMLLLLSIVLMSVIWLALAAFLTLMVLETLAMWVFWNIPLLAIIGFLLAFVVWLIPLQVIRYIRQLRASP
jgi:hypothetical protein